MDPNDQKLDQLFQRYAQACAPVDGSANFMPGVWQRIESRRGWIGKLASYSRSLALVAASLCLAVGLFEMSPYGPDYQLTASNYVDVLDDDHDAEALTYADPAHIEAIQ